jgi:hypothetical protein
MNGNLKWIEKQSTFIYNGESVIRTELSIDTILGKIKVYESVDGKVFYHFLGDLELKQGGYSLRLLGQVIKTEVGSLEEGISICEEKWTKVKEIINLT